jgi:hypothetical protein
MQLTQPSAHCVSRPMLDGMAKAESGLWRNPRVAIRIRRLFPRRCRLADHLCRV